ncbi:hypothetical protein BOX15_Mlig028235g4 [Macrostomum lignano]|uniref:Reverse transcriptase n=1 Tax=Macrostomum lignano TaxID=282301 RepID=A0A267FX25_9PLAT|nr:hypothetical protein BOX15_Mlig028235g4 [Macrostomum lignano]
MKQELRKLETAIQRDVAAEKKATEKREKTVEADISSQLVNSGLFLDSQINGLSEKILVDTGASNCLIDKKLYQRLYPANHSLKPCSVNMRSANGQTSNLLGQVALRVRFGDCEITHPFYVAEGLLTSSIIGIDLLTRHKIKLDIAGKSLEFSDRRIPLVTTSDETRCVLLQVVKKVSIAPMSEIYVKAKCKDTPETAELGFISGRSQISEKDEPLVAKAITRLDEFGETYVRLMNLTEEAQTIHKDEVVAQYQPMKEEVELFAMSETDLEVGAQKQSKAAITVQEADRLREQFRLNETDLSEAQKRKVIELFHRYQNIVSKDQWDIGKTQMGEFKIETTDEIPVRIPLRKQSPEQREFVSGHVQQLLEHDLIEPSESEWSCPIVLARKKSGEFRFCCDFRQLNNKTKKDSFPLPLIQESLESLAGNMYFSTLDMVGAYWSVKVRETDREKLAFRTHDGLFQWKVLPFGVTNGPACFQRIMQKILGDYAYKFALLYLDDVICTGRNFEEMLRNLELIFSRLADAGMKIKPEKIFLFRKEVTFLGHTVCQHGIYTSKDKIEKVQTWPRPENISELRGFLGLAGYYRRFIKDFARISEPLNNLTRKDVKYKWDDSCQKAFDLLKQKLVSAPVLSYPRFDSDAGPFILDVDACDVAIGGNLLQEQDGEEKVIAYASHPLNEHQLNYCTTMKEMFALIYFLEHYRPYLVGRRFKVRTDHAALQWLRKCHGAKGMLGRWNMILEQFDQFEVISRMEEYDFAIQYRQGIAHGNADALSRRPQRDGPPKRYHEECPTCSATKTATVHCGAINIDTPAGIVELQESQPELLLLKQKLRQGEPCPPKNEWVGMSRSYKSLFSDYEQLLVKNDIIYRNWIDSEGRKFEQTVLPENQALEQQLFRAYHDQMAHGGISKTKDLIRQRFWWPNYSTNLDRYIKTCTECQTRKKYGPKPRAPLEPEVSSYMGEKVHTDFAGPFNATARGNKYLLLMVDHFTGWLEVKALRDCTAESTAWALYTEWITRHGAPEAFISDRGTSFTAELVKSLTENFRIDLRHTTSYHPQANGRCERMVRVVKDGIRLAQSELSLAWDEVLPHALMVQRSTISESNKFSPFELVYGRKMRLPVDAELGLPAPERKTRDKHLHDLYKKCMESYRIAREKQQISVRRQKSNYDTKVFQQYYQPGDLVWIANTQNCYDTNRKWVGPYRVLEVRNNGKNLKIEPGPKVDRIEQPVRIHDVVTVHRTKPCYLSEEKLRQYREEEAGSASDDGSEESEQVQVEIQRPERIRFLQRERAHEATESNMNRAVENTQTAANANQQTQASPAGSQARQIPVRTPPNLMHLSPVHSTPPQRAGTNNVSWIPRLRNRAAIRPPERYGYH